MALRGMKYTESRVTDVEQFLVDPNYVLSQKLDGTRVMTHLTRRAGEDVITFTGHGGQPIKFAAAKQHFKKLEDYFLGSSLPTCVLDGELMLSGDYHIFDMPYMREAVLPEDPFSKRWQQVVDNSRLLTLAPTAFSESDKRWLWSQIVDKNSEGAIVRPVDSIYEIGKRSNIVKKLKIVKTVDVVVTGVNRPDPKHGAARLGVYDENGVMKPVGACSLIGKPHVEVGDVIEVACLYATASLVLYQPRMMRVREDKAAVECTIDQVRQWVTSREIIAL